MLELGSGLGLGARLRCLRVRVMVRVRIRVRFRVRVRVYVNVRVRVRVRVRVTVKWGGSMSGSEYELGLWLRKGYVRKCGIPQTNQKYPAGHNIHAGTRLGILCTYSLLKGRPRPRTK